MVSATAKESCVNLTRPAAVLDATWRVVERCPAQRHAADICGGRRKRARKLVADRRVLGTGVADAPRIFGVDRTLRRIVRVAEGDITFDRSGIRRGHCRCRHHSTHGCRRQHFTSREHFLSLLVQGKKCERLRDRDDVFACAIKLGFRTVYPRAWFLTAPPFVVFNSSRCCATYTAEVLRTVAMLDHSAACGCASTEAAGFFFSPNSLLCSRSR